MVAMTTYPLNMASFLRFLCAVVVAGLCSLSPSSVVAFYYPALQQKDRSAQSLFTKTKQPRHVVSPLLTTIQITTSRQHNQNGDTVSAPSPLVIHPAQNVIEEEENHYHGEDVPTTRVAASSITTSTSTTTASEFQESPSALQVKEPESPTSTTTTTKDRQLSPLMKDLLHRTKIGFYFGLRKLSPLTRDLLHRAKIGFYFGVWYAFNVAYNGTNDMNKV
jgi:hypothetical protein